VSARAPKPARSSVLTEPLGGSPLSVAVQTGRLPAALHLPRPSSVAEWKQHADRVRGAASSGWLDAIRASMAPRGRAAERLERVVAERGIVVTTGQQAGLFGGPLYTLAKALTAVELADVLEKALGVATAPVFWAATDDADFLEAAVAHVADAEGLHELTLTRRPAPGTPMALAPLGDVTPLLEQLRKSSGSAAHAKYFEIAHEAFTTERTLGDAYVRLLRDLFEPLGIAVLDSSHAAVRDAARPTLVEAVQRAETIARASAERAAEIRRAGYSPQVEDDRGLSLVFVMEDTLKRRLQVDEARKLERSPRSSAALSPNVLLRPVLERTLLPTVAYVGGPGELAYFIQANAVAAALDRDPVVGVPRWSCTIIEPFVARALQRLNIDHVDLKDRHALERRLAVASLPEPVAGAWRRLQEQMHAAVMDLSEAVQRADLLPQTVIDGLEHSFVHRMSRAERRLIAAAKRRNEQVHRDLEMLSGALYPNGNRQERVLNYIPMLARAGDTLVNDMRAAAAAHASSLVQAPRMEPHPLSREPAAR
jgi:bacillithiol biosynthesis cysteine-adding enzyme BshC